MRYLATAARGVLEYEKYFDDYDSALEWLGSFDHNYIKRTYEIKQEWRPINVVPSSDNPSSMR